MNVENSGNELLQVVTLLGAAVVTVPLFRRLGLGSILGYLVAGLAIGPFGLALFTEPEAILHVAELGVVLFLFVIGLEMRPSHLWGLRREIFGLGSLQIFACAALLTGLGVAAGFPVSVSFIGGMGFVLTSTAIVMQVLAERGDIAHPNGQKIVSILLFEDLLIVPLLALVALLSPVTVEPASGSRLAAVGIAFGAIILLIAAGKWLLNPLFRILALAKAREVMTAAALLAVLGSALLMQSSGLSMAMGAFLAGVLLAESSFRHQIEADLEPFRGILLGLFFIGVGMSLNLSVVKDNYILIAVGVLAMMVVKAVGIYGVARLMGSNNAEALDRATLMAQGGEFAFVLYTAAAGAKVIDAADSANLTAIVVLSMALTPLVATLFHKYAPPVRPATDGVEEANGLSGSVLLIGFGRFGQVMSQLLLARNVDVTIIDSDADRIRNAARFGFKIYYGDGGNLNVLRASGAATVRAIAVCVDEKEQTNRIVEMARNHFPQAKLLVRSYDRIHSRELVRLGVDFQIRETFESAMLFGEAALRELDVSDDEVREISADIRRRERERFELEMAGAIDESRALMIGNVPKPDPLISPKRASRPLNEEADAAVRAANTEPS